MDNVKRYVAEFLGTFALVFIGAGAVIINPGLLGVGFAHGLVLMAMIYSLSHISGAHFNPAITIAMLATRKINVVDSGLYIISQLAGAAVAGLLLFGILAQFVPDFPQAGIYGFPKTVPFMGGVALEAVLTFFLALTVFGTAVDARAQKGFYGISIGMVLVFDILVGGALTGAAMNPARAFGVAIASGFFDTHAIYWVGPVIGALAAALLYNYGLIDNKK